MNGWMCGPVTIESIDGSEGHISTFPPQVEVTPQKNSLRLVMNERKKTDHLRGSTISFLWNPGEWYSGSVLSRSPKNGLDWWTVQWKDGTKAVIHLSEEKHVRGYWKYKKLGVFSPSRRSKWYHTKSRRTVQVTEKVTREEKIRYPQELLQAPRPSSTLGPTPTTSYKAEEDGQLSEYERSRLKRIAENKAKLDELGIGSALTEFRNVASDPNGRSQRPTSQPLKRKVRRAKDLRPPAPKRRSARVSGMSAVNYNEVPVVSMDTLSTVGDEQVLDAVKYFHSIGVTPKVVSEGHYSGWINPELIDKYGFASSAEEAWAQGGGGTFSYKNPGGNGSTGKVCAKEFARKMIFKNPNAYFYRHPAPGVPHRFDADFPWTKEEENKFVLLAKKYGCGDKWGLFATWFEGRVGYQCSQYYRKHMIKNGLIVDPSFAMSVSGEPIYVGKRGSKRQ